MNPISEKLGLQPDILEGATIVKMFGTEYAIIENYKSLIEYTECLVKVQGKHMRVVIEGEKLGIESFQPDECRVCGKIEKIYFASYEDRNAVDHGIHRVSGAGRASGTIYEFVPAS